MKRKSLLVALPLLLLTEMVSAQGFMIYKKDGTVLDYPFTEIDSLVAYPATVSQSGMVAVDLGLPSGTKWASCNIGATNPEDYGDYFAWGETETKSNYTESTYSYYDSLDSTYIDIGTNIAGTRYDVATVKWGSSWCMPTSTQIDELISNCTWTWTTLNEVNGYLVIGTNGNSVFLPAAGEKVSTYHFSAGSRGIYYSASYNSKYARYAYYLSFDSSGQGSYIGDYRCRGRSIRPVSN